MGHGRSGGLRPSASALLPRHRRHPHVFLHRQSRQSREHPREVDPRGASLLSQRADNPGGKQEGSATRRQHDPGVEEDEARAGETRGGPRHGREDQRIRLPRVFGQDEGGRPRGVRDGHQGGAAGEEEASRALQPPISLGRR